MERSVKHLQTIIIGGGVVGLACAKQLVDAHQNVLVLEAGERVGGQFSGQVETVEALRRQIEQQHGEVVTQARVIKLKANPHKKECLVQTEWGTIGARHTIITIDPMEQKQLAAAHNLPGLIRLERAVKTLQSAQRAGVELAQAVLRQQTVSL